MTPTYYIDLIKQVKIGNYRGRKILAKPILLLSIIEVVETKIVTKNQYFYDALLPTYKNLYQRYLGTNVTPMYKPYFFLQHDGFWHLKYANGQIQITSIKMLKENVEYASLDNMLWDLLQDADFRNELNSEIIKFFKLH